MDRYDYIESIVSFLKGVTGINYQLQLKEILAVYYKYFGKFYGLFYQVFAPTILKDSLKKEIQEKFVEDLSGLLNIIYEEKNGMED